MHDIEPWWGWRDEYTAENDPKSPFYGREYNEFLFTNKIYNYYIHPQWDDFGSETLYAKILYSDYIRHYALIELVGEWNDCIGNDIMFLKRDIIDRFIKQDIKNYILLCDNVLNFHGSDDCYYEEWKEDIEEGQIFFVNTHDHVYEEMRSMGIHRYVNFQKNNNQINWRKMDPNALFELLYQKTK